MIELEDYLGNKVLINSKDIESIREYYDSRYPSINTTVKMYNGRKYECVQKYKVIKELITYSFTIEDMIDFATDQKNRDLNPTDESLKDWIDYK